MTIQRTIIVTSADLAADLSHDGQTFMDMICHLDESHPRARAETINEIATNYHRSKRHERVPQFLRDLADAIETSAPARNT